MPRPRPLIPGARVGENEYNRLLAQKLGERGFTDSQFEPIIHVRTGGTQVVRKPDVGFRDGGFHVVSGKLEDEFAAYRTADEYKVIFETLPDFGESFAVTYPKRLEGKFHVHALPRTGRSESLPMVCDTLDDVADRIAEVVRGYIEQARRFLEPAAEFTPRFLRNAGIEISATIRGVPVEDLERVFGGREFFDSVLSGSVPVAHRKETLQRGAAFLFINQLLFYTLLSRAAAEGGKPEMYPPISPEHFASPTKLWELYFSRVRERDYEPIYGNNVAPFFTGKGASVACRSVASALAGLAPRLETRDVAGQVFQTLIPLDIRKPLGAHYTNPHAAALLANLAIDSSKVRALDPTCGSGTLLVAAYHRKLALLGRKATEEDHRRFVEEEITGVDAMAFAGHLAAVNLALQQPLLETDHVRIGMTDSTHLTPGFPVPTTGAALPSGFRRSHLMENFPGPTSRNRQRIPQLGRIQPKGFTIGDLDLVIMNPPFTAWERMAVGYRNRIADRFSNGESRVATSGRKIGQHVYFLLIADNLLKDGGRIAAVLPLTTLGGHDYWPLVEYLLRHYTVEYIVVGFGRTSFSEDTSLSECLLVLHKGRPSEDAEFTLVGTLTSPETWTDAQIEAVSTATKRGRGLEGLTLVTRHRQSQLSPQGDMLPLLAFRLLEDFEVGYRALGSLSSLSTIPLVPFQRLRERGIVYKERIEKARHIEEYGASALFVCRTAKRALKKLDRLVVDQDSGHAIIARDRIGERAGSVRFGRNDVVPALRRLAYLPYLDVSKDSDYAASKVSPALERAMRMFYSERDATRKLSRLRSHTLWEGIVKNNSSRVIAADRIDFAGPGTTLVACRSATPMFLACPNYMANGFKSEDEEKLFVLWMNSTMGIMQLLPSASSTRGSWVRVERYTVDRVLFPDFSRLTEDDWGTVRALWKELGKMRLKSILDQLVNHDEFRQQLDDQLLSLLGISASRQRKQLSSSMRDAAASAIQALRQAMGAGAGNDE